MKLQEGQDHWALVTGASSGIGREFCRSLAAAGMHVAMVARRESLLTSLAKEIHDQHRVQTLPIPEDISRDGAAARIHETLKQHGATVRLLVNNAASGRWGPFENESADNYQNMIHLNTTALVSLCREFLPDLVSFPTSAVINVSSQAAYQPVPFMAVYGATKAFVHSFSQALYGEWKKRGVHVQTLVPGPTESEFDAKAGAYEVGITRRGSPRDVVAAALAGLPKDQPVVASIRGTYKQRLFAAIAPSRMVIQTVAKMFAPPSGP